MKKLFIIRHAKSSWKDLQLDDFDRPLNKRGKRDAPIMGERVRKRAIFPDKIIASPALRAKRTAEIIAQQVDYKKEIHFDKNMYDTDVMTLIEIVKSVENHNNTLFLVGHNQELNMLVEAYIDFEENIPTCGIVEIAFSVDKWEEIDSNSATLLSFDYPKNTKEKN